MDGVTSSTQREQRATRVSRRKADSELFAAAAAATAALDRLNQGVALIDRVCRVSFANSLANAICRETDGLSLRSGELIATAKPDSARLSQALKRAVDGGLGASLRLARPSQRRPLSVLISPLQLPPGFPSTPAALVVINDPERSAAPPKERLMQAYGLTAAEAGVAQLLLRGNDVAAVARRLCISLETARTHLRRLLVKTGTHRQSDLILVLVREVGAIV
ncbi:MAG TPA: helix-turn-helix transcriptional regulator [Steroidobacteraceae bacterium]|nr:helix-turn-helix transcriptional regulator [Steroidobacteraceae bacterium]